MLQVTAHYPVIKGNQDRGRAETTAYWLIQLPFSYIADPPIQGCCCPGRGLDPPSSSFVNHKNAPTDICLQASLMGRIAKPRI